MSLTIVTSFPDIAIPPVLLTVPTTEREVLTAAWALEWFIIANWAHEGLEEALGKALPQFDEGWAKINCDVTGCPALERYYQHQEADRRFAEYQTWLLATVKTRVRESATSNPMTSPASSAPLYTVECEPPTPPSEVPASATVPAQPASRPPALPSDSGADPKKRKAEAGGAPKAKKKKVTDDPDKVYTRDDPGNCFVPPQAEACDWCKTHGQVEECLFPTDQSTTCVTNGATPLANQHSPRTLSAASNPPFGSRVGMVVLNLGPKRRGAWASGRVKAKDLRESLYNDIKDLYLKDNEKQMEGWERDSLRHGVHTFVQLWCKQCSKAARVGTRRLTWRDVLYYQMPQDVAKTKKKLMTKTGKPAFHVHQQAITLVSKKLSSAKVARLKVIASAWNLTGPPDDYKVRNALKKLDRRTQEFVRDVLTQHGAIYFFMYAFKGADGGIQTGTQEWTNLFRGRSFDVERRKQWDGSGAFAIWDLWAKDFLLGEDGAAARAGPADLVNGKDPALFQLERNADDQPLLPNLNLKKFDKATVHMKYSTWVAAVFRAFVSYWYGVGRGVVGRRVKVPWKFLKEHTITDWIAEEFVPEGSERLGDPDKDMNGLEGLLPLLEHWYERQESGKAEVLRFHHVAEPISGQNKKYRHVPSADEPDDFTLPPRPDAANTDSGDEDLAGKDSEEKGGEAPQSVAVHGVGSEDSEDEIVAQTQRKHRKSEKRTGKDVSDDSDTHSATLAKWSSQKSGAHQGRGGASDSEGVVHGRPRHTKSGLLARPTDSNHSDVEVGDQPKWRGQQRKGRGMIVRSDDDVGTPVGAPDVPDAQYCFVEGGSKYEDLGVEEESDTPLAQKGPKASGTQESDSDNSNENDVTKMLDHVEDSEEPEHAPPRQLREETPTPAGGQSSGSGKGGTTNGKGQTKTKSGGAKDGGQGKVEKRGRNVVPLTQRKRKARDEDEDEDSLARGKKKVRESGRDTEPDTWRTRAQSGKQTAGTRTAPPPETPDEAHKSPCCSDPYHGSNTRIDEA
ncbi:hypothetical protein FA13DRAFT_1707527 [Coprinellus micaceus]|uniref:Uncharacterized protein n=1 Tax=Coprinellus micaceus TaxID=71717 RepID=A0A4Y7TKF9_COPMI|nr:hypothetical protein FA13DRAFT_1707527 [Coprinellus micaceus]